MLFRSDLGKDDDDEVCDYVSRPLPNESASHTMEDPTQSDPVAQQPSPVLNYPTYAIESACVRSMTMEDGTVMEIHGSDDQGYTVRSGQRALRSQFRSLAEAEIACEMFLARARRSQAPDLSQDYVEEA